MLSRSRSGLQGREEYPEVGFLEELVKKKDQLVERLDVNDELLETTVDQMTEKKKHIREEQNLLLKELEDLGLKMKDFDLLTGNSFKNFTVISPFMTRIAQQLIQQLKEVAENFSNKEMKGQIEGYLKALDEEKAIKDELVSSILLNDPQRLGSDEEEFQMKIDETLAMQLEMVERSETLTNHLVKMERELDEAKEYQARFEELKHKKDLVCQTVNQTGEDLESVLRQKEEIETKLKEVQSLIQEKSENKLKLNKLINKFLDDYNTQFSGKLSEISKTLRNDAPEDSDQIYDFFQHLKQTEISAHMDYTFEAQDEIEECFKTLLQYCTAIQDIFYRTGEEGCSQETEATFFQSEHPGLKRNYDPIINAFAGLLSNAVVIKRLNTSGKITTIWPRLVQSTIEFIEKQKEFWKMYCDLCGRKLKAVYEYKNLMDDALKLEQETVLLNRMKTQIIHSIPQIKSENKEINSQLQKLMVYQECKYSNRFIEESKYGIDSNCGEYNQCWDESMEQSIVLDANQPCIYDDILVSKFSQDPSPAILMKEGIVSEIRKELDSLSQRISSSNLQVKELTGHLAQIADERGSIQENLKVLRQELIESLQRDGKLLTNIRGHFDYISRPVLSRDVGISVLDNIINDLQNSFQQIQSEINRQKRILKHVSKNEDYSHEGK